MVEKLQVYKCNVCGNIVEVVHASVGTLVCCGQPMQLLEEKLEGLAKKSMFQLSKYLMEKQR